MRATPIGFVDTITSGLQAVHEVEPRVVMSATPWDSSVSLGSAAKMTARALASSSVMTMCLDICVPPSPLELLVGVITL